MAAEIIVRVGLAPRRRERGRGRVPPKLLGEIQGVVLEKSRLLRGVLELGLVLGLVGDGVDDVVL